MWQTTPSTSTYYDRAQEQEQFNQTQELEKQKIELQKKELQVKQQQQDTQHLLTVGSLSLGGALVIVIAFYLLARLFKGRRMSK